MSQFIHQCVDCIDTAMPKAIKRLIKRVLPNIERRITNFLKLITPASISTLTIRSGPLKGRKFCCSLKNERSYWLGIYETDTADIIRRLLSKGNIYYDIGVHKGYFSLIAAQCVGESGKVIGFEPNKYNLSMTQENLALNPDLADIIQLEALAVSDTTDSVLFSGRPSATTGKIVDQNSGTDTYQVNAIPLNEYVEKGNPFPDVIKMDIEGAEVKGPSAYKLPNWYRKNCDGPVIMRGCRMHKLSMDWN